MSLFSENIIPGNYGKIFGTDAKNHTDLMQIKNRILTIEGIRNVLLNETIFPRQFMVQTSKLVNVKKVQNCVKELGFHAIPNRIFQS